MIQALYKVIGNNNITVLSSDLSIRGQTFHTFKDKLSYISLSILEDKRHIKISSNYIAQNYKNELKALTGDEELQNIIIDILYRNLGYIDSDIILSLYSIINNLVLESYQINSTYIDILYPKGIDINYILNKLKLILHWESFSNIYCKLVSN